ncbi:hypothetical protein [uncultured Muribaculum sp.]|uniref:hypothetical protein n=1 Tax=uncultured Muribaculum sp. TaxID=1918613 RepID=UPI0025D25222|nr:hypothetical protein [uncultured Muribaculum sp.]
MEISRKLAILALSGLIGAGFTACGGDDDDIQISTEGTQGTVTPPTTEPGAVDPTVTGTLAPAEAGKYIENTAKQFEQVCNPQDQKAAVQSLMTIASVFEKYNGDSDDEEDYPYMVSNGVRAIARAVESGDYAGISRAVQQVTNNASFNPYTYRGVYTPVYDAEEDEYAWVKTLESENAIIFRSEQDRVEVSLTMSGDTWTGKFTTNEYDYDYDYDPNTGDYNYTEYDITTHWTVNVPAKMTFVMSHNGQAAASAVVESNYNEGGHTFAIKTSVSVANIQTNGDVSGTDSKVTEKCSATVGSTRVLYSVGEVNGSGLCDRNKIDQLVNAGHVAASAQVDNIFKGATAKVDIIDRIQLNSTCSSLKQIVANGGYNEDVEDEVRAMATALNNNVKTTLKFGNTDFEQGTITWKCMPHSYTSGWGEEWEYTYTWYQADPVITLSDGVDMSLGSFMESGSMQSVVRTLESIRDTYMRAFGMY